MSRIVHAIDTNVLVRFVMGDDPAQLKKVLQLFDSAVASGERFFVSSLVLIEFIWVLECFYKIPRERILFTLEKLSDVAVLQWEDAPLLPHFLSAAQESSIDISDLLIAARNQRPNQLTTLTFDRKAVKKGKGMMALL